MIPKRQYRELSQEEAAQLRRRGLTGHDARALGLLMPVAGGEETPEEKAAREQREQEEREAEEARKREEEDDDDDDDDDDDVVKVPKAERDAKERELAQLRREKAEREKAARKEKERQAREAGRHEELANEAIRERDEAKAEEAKAKEELATFKARVVVGAVAQRLNFKDPTDAYRFLDKDDIVEDEKVVEAALKRVTRTKKYLVDERKPSGGGHGGNNGGGKDLYTFEDMQKMSTQEIRDNQEKVDRSWEAIGASS